MTSDPPGDPVLALVRRVDRLDRAQREILQRVTSLADSVTRVQRAAGGDEDDDSWLPAWLLVEDSAEAVARVADLVGWLDDVYLRYGDADLPVCWLWHPDAVEELLVLRERWREAYHGGRKSWAAVSDWHDRARPGVVRRLERLGTCDLERHGIDGKLAQPRRAALRQAIEVVASMWAVSRELPVPSESDVEAARRHVHLPLSASAIDTHRHL